MTTNPMNLIGHECRKADWMVGKYIRQSDPEGYVQLLDEARRAEVAKTAEKVGLPLTNS